MSEANESTSLGESPKKESNMGTENDTNTPTDISFSLLKVGMQALIAAVDTIQTILQIDGERLSDLEQRVAALEESTGDEQ